MTSTLATQRGSRRTCHRRPSDSRDRPVSDHTGGTALAVGADGAGRVGRVTTSRASLPAIPRPPSQLPDRLLGRRARRRAPGRHGRARGINRRMRRVGHPGGCGAFRLEPESLPAVDREDAEFGAGVGCPELGIKRCGMERIADLRDQQRLAPAGYHQQQGAVTWVKLPPDATQHCRFCHRKYIEPQSPSAAFRVPHRTGPALSAAPRYPKCWYTWRCSVSTGRSKPILPA